MMDNCITDGGQRIRTMSQVVDRDAGGRIRVTTYYNPNLGGSAADLSIALGECRAENKRLRAALEAARIVLRDLVDVGIAFNGIVDPNGPEAQALKKVVAALGKGEGE